jgi:hypothetical protein
MGKASLGKVAIVPDAPVSVSAGRHVLRCVGPMIVLDDAGRATTNIGYELSRRGLGHTTVKGKWTRSVLVGGWHAVSGLPKPSDDALIAGSSWVVDVPADETQIWSRALADGLGYRRREGFGVVELDPTPWRPHMKPPVAESDDSPSARLAGAVRVLLDVLDHERDTKKEHAGHVNQVRDVLRALISAQSDAALEAVRQRPFWVRRAGSSISAREVLVSLIDDADAAVRRRRARDALLLLEVNEMDRASGKDGVR